MKHQVKATCQVLAKIVLLMVGMVVFPSCHHDHSGHDHGKHGHKHHKTSHSKTGKHDKGKKHDEHKDDHGDEVKLSKAALRHVRLQTYILKPRPQVTQQFAVVGRVTLPPSQSSHVGSRVSGRILRWYVKQGQKIVRRGQSLALLDSPTVGKVRASYLKAKALHRIAGIELQRTSRLKKSGLASSKQLLAARVMLQKASINLQSARAQLRILGVSRPSLKKGLHGRIMLSAPATGEVSRILQKLGAWVTPQTTILTIENRTTVWVQLEVYAHHVPFVRVGQEVHLYGQGLHSHLKGTISYLASRFDKGAQTLEARVVLSNPRGQLRPNQLLYAYIKGGKNKVKKKQNILLIPEDAVQRLGRRKVVFVRGDESGHFYVRTIVVVEAPGGFVRVLYGLRVGEKVIVKGSFLLKSVLLRSSLEGGHGHAH